MRQIILCLSLLFLTSCKINKRDEILKEKKWVYLEIISYDKKKSEAVYGEISISDLNLIKENNNDEKLISVTNSRYNDEDSGIVKKFSEEDIENGTFFYKIKNIEYVEILKKDPLNYKVELLKEN